MPKDKIACAIKNSDPLLFPEIVGMRPTEKLRRHAKFRSMGGGSKFNLRQRFMLVLFVAV